MKDAALHGIAAELADPKVITLLAHQDRVLVAYAQVRRKAPPGCVTRTHARGA